MEALQIVPKKYRFIPQNLMLAESGSFCTAYRYGSVDPIEGMLAPGFFLPHREQFRAGDTVRIYQLRDSDVNSRVNRVIAYVDVVIVASSRAGVVLEAEYAPRFMPVEGESDGPEASPVKAVAKAEARWKGPDRRWEVWPLDGKEALATGILDKTVAEQMASGEVPLPG